MQTMSDVTEQIRRIREDASHRILALLRTYAQQVLSDADTASRAATYPGAIGTPPTASVSPAPASVNPWGANASTRKRASAEALRILRILHQRPTPTKLLTQRTPNTTPVQRRSALEYLRRHEAIELKPHRNNARTYFITESGRGILRLGRPA